jgi:hypothetical protein
MHLVRKDKNLIGEQKSQKNRDIKKYQIILVLKQKHLTSKNGNKSWQKHLNPISEKLPLVREKKVKLLKQKTNIIVKNKIIEGRAAKN